MTTRSTFSGTMIKPTLETMIEETEEENCGEYPFGFSNDPNPLDPFFFPDHKPNTIPPKMKNAEAENGIYSKSELDEREAEMFTYRNGSFRCCFDEIPEYQMCDNMEDFKSDLNWDPPSFDPAFCAQVHLLNILEQHNTDLGLFNGITEWIKFHSNRKESVQWGSAQLLSRK